MPRGNSVPLDLYLNLVFPWDDPADHQLFKTVSWTFMPQGGTSLKDLKYSNFAAQSYDGLTRLIETRIPRAYANVYVAIGTQRMADFAKTTSDGFPKAIRQLPNMVSSRAIYLDLDVKPGAYATTADAKAAVKAFIAAIGLPRPSIAMLSGSGGLHIYWCDHKPIPIATWKLFAEALRDAAVAFGLHIDQGVTVNPVGILRVPGGFNHKMTPPTQVVFDPYSSFARYDVASYIPALSAYAAQHGQRAAAMPAGGSKTKYTQNFTANVGAAAPTPTVDELGACCPLIAQTLLNAGIGQREPMWNLMMLAAAFTADPTDAAHRLSSGHAGYIPADTDQKLADKINARANNQSIGWPKCASFDMEQQGQQVPSVCQTCPHFQQAKSPFNFVTQQQAQQAQTAALASNTTWLPQGYWLDANAHVWGSLKSEGGNVHDVEIIAYPVLDAGIDQDSEELVFQAEVAGKVRTCKVNVSSCTSDAAAATEMVKAGVILRPTIYKAARTFIMAWVTHLQDIRQATSQSLLGWTEDCTGFTYDKLTYLPGTQRFAYTAFKDNRYRIKGDLKPWQDAMHLVYGNPQLEATVASAFAAPLIELYGSTPVIMSIFSPESGVGKSTALKLGQTVWGNPSSMLSLTDTNNAFMHKISNMRSLPCYWDELRTHKDMEKCADLIFVVTQGKSKARLNRVIQLNESNSFKTMFVVASNYGLNEAIYSQTVGTEAGGLRVFELQIDPIVNSNYSIFDSTQLMSKLDHSNYGNAGVQFIQYVVANQARVLQAIKMKAGKLAADHKLETKERFWASTMATLSIGAFIANRCGLTQFNVPAIDACLDAALERARQNMADQTYRTMSRTDASDSVFHEMLAFARAKDLVVTDTIPTPAKGVRAAPQIMVFPLDTTRLANPWVWMGDKDGRIRVRCTEFDKYMRERGLSPEEMRRQLAKTYVIDRGKRAMFSGVQGLDYLGAGRYFCYDFVPIGPSPSTTPGSSEPTPPED